MPYTVLDTTRYNTMVSKIDLWSTGRRQTNKEALSMQCDSGTVRAYVTVL